jgi:hypothetical protein
MNGRLAKLMAKADPKLYRKYLMDEKGKKVILTPPEGFLHNDEECTLVDVRTEGGGI